MAIQRWEYLFLRFAQYAQEEMQSYSNEKGNEGWELVGATNMPDPVIPNLEASEYSDEASIQNHQILLTFKRPK